MASIVDPLYKLLTDGPSYYSTEATVHVMNIAFQRALTHESPKIAQPPEILLPMKDHQKAVVHAMMEHEKQCMTGIPYKNTTTITNFGVIGDEVGSGKSLSVLAFIAMKKKEDTVLVKKQILCPNSSNHFFTTYTQDYTLSTKSPSLIIVPHTIYRQWQDYCKKQTTLNVFYAKSQKEVIDLYSPQDSSANIILKEKILSSDAVLVSNTLFPNIRRMAEDWGITWNRVFIDEADSIHVPGTNMFPDTRFAWFITATWPSFIMNNHYIRTIMLQHFNPALHHTDMLQWLQSELGSTTYTPSNYYTHPVFLKTRSANWLRSYFSEHPLKCINVMLCSKAFLKESQKMPPIQESIVLCEQPATHRAVLSLVSADIGHMIHAGNIEGALEQLGVNVQTATGLVEAVTKEREKELDRLMKTLVFKEQMEYATPQAKETAISSLKTKIASVQEQLKTFKERLSASNMEECPVCYDDPKQNQATLTPCCHRIFCGACILTSLTKQATCPMCRSALTASKLTQLVEEKPKKKAKAEKEEAKLLSKPKQLLKFLKEKPQAKVLVFSRYENPFVALEKDCENAGITYQTLRGNKDVIANIIKSFEAGEKRVLFLPTQTAGAGINLVGASHVVLLHAMTPEEEKQVVGRAYRLGRSQSLNVIKLLHDGEKI